MRSAPLVVVAGLLVACSRRDDSRAGDATTTAAELPGHVAQSPPRDVVPDPEPGPGAEPAPSPAPSPPPPASATAQRPGIVEPPLPKWVPESGRLTIVQAPDLARNLGLE